MKRKSILKALLLTVLMCCLTFALVACGGKHTVTFNYGVDGNGDGEVDVVTVEVGDGSLLEEPTDVPTREGYTFVGWGTDDGMWNFEEDTVTSDLTLTARWSAGDPVDPGTPGTTVYVNYDLGNHAAESASAPARWSGAPGTTIKLPDAPAANAGWEFTGWLVEKETELRAAGSDYTVTGTVTITAQWKSVAYTQYTWTVEAQPDASNPGKAKGTPVGGGKDITVDLPAFPADGGYADVPTAGKYNVETTKATCTESAKKTLYYTIPQKPTYESYYLKIREDSLDEPAKGHLYTTWIVTNPSATAAGTATATCANNCGKTLTITLPELDTAGVYTITGDAATCETQGEQEYTYTISDEALKDNGVNAAAGTDKELSFTVTPPATGHKIEIEVQLSDATDTNTVTKASLIARCRNAGCDKGWNEEAAPANATVTFDLGSGNIQSGGVTLAKEDVTFNPETEQFTVTLPDKDAMTLTAGTIFTGWKVGDTPYAAGSTISVDADDPIAVTGNFMKHTHNYDYGDITFVTSGDNAGKFVATCSEDGCPEPTVVVAETSDNDISVTLKNQVYIGGKITVDDFTVTVTYKYQIAWGDNSVGDPYLTITLGDAEDKTYQSYFSNNLETLSTDAWASGLQATFEFKVDSKTIASGTATFDVVPAADDIFGEETTASILYQNEARVEHESTGPISNTENGVSFSFWLDAIITNDWLPVIGDGLGWDIGLPNVDPFDSDGTGGGAGAFPAADELRNNAVYSVFLYNKSLVTITLEADGSVIYYRNGIKVIEYATTKALGSATFATAIPYFLSQMESVGIIYGGADAARPAAMSHMIISTALTDAEVTNLYNWYAPKYMTDDAALKSSVETALSGVTVHLVDAGPASAALVSASSLTNVATEGLAVTFRIPNDGVGNSDWSPAIEAGNGYAITLGILDAFTVTEAPFAGAGWRSFEANAVGPDGTSNGSTDFWSTFTSGGCYMTICIIPGEAETDGVYFYKDGELAFRHQASKSGSDNNTAATIGDFVEAILSKIQANGLRVAGALSGTNHTWAENMVITSALDGTQVAALYNALNPTSAS